MDRINHNEMNVYAGSCGHFYLSLKDEPWDNDFIYGHINTNMTIDSNYEAEYKGHDIMPTADYFEFVGTDKKENGFVTEYKIEKWHASIKENVTFIPGMNVVVQNTTYTNNYDRILSFRAYLRLKYSASVLVEANILNRIDLPFIIAARPGAVRGSGSLNPFRSLIFFPARAEYGRYPSTE